MLPKDAINLLREHSGLHTSTSQLEGAAFVDKVQAIQKRDQETDLDEAVADVIHCLQCLNHYNRSVPDERIQILNVDVVYAISGMMLFTIEASVALRKSGEDCSKLLMAAWRIGCAWDALLAGDIEDIYQHLEHEAAARNID